MRCLLRFVFGLVVALVTTGTAHAWHIIGGEMYYEHVTGNTYKIYLKLYRDCYSVGGAPYDDPARLSVYNGTTLVTTFGMDFPGSETLPVVLDADCYSAPPSVCVEEAIYVTTMTFDNIPATGLRVVYQRCCRNSTILNIYDPANVGTTYETTIMPNNGGNNSVYFKNFPPIAICANEELVFDHSAIDPDGDSLVYELCAPYTGGGSTGTNCYTCTAPDPAPPPPYPTVNFVPPYGVNNMLGGTPPMYINPQTGMLYAKPNAVGQFVVGVCVKEYRNGVLLQEHKRDFQFNVAPCARLVHADFIPEVQSGNGVTTGDVIEHGDTITICGGLTIKFNDASNGANFHAWNFGDPNTAADTSHEKNPVYAYPDTGCYNLMLYVDDAGSCSDTVHKVIQLRDGVKAKFVHPNICRFTPVAFQDSSFALDGEIVSWTWDFGGGAVQGGPLQTHTFTKAGTATVSLEVQNDFGCRSSVTRSVVINPAPTVTAGPDTTICDLDSVRLFASASVSYQWSPDYNLSETDLQSPMAEPDITTTYVVSVTNEFNCEAKDSTVITVVDTVIATAWPDTTVCTGQPVMLHADGAVRYEWTPENVVKRYKNWDQFYAVPFDTTTVYVRSSIGSCFDVDSVTLATIPSPNVQTVESRVINQGDTVQLNAVGALSYVWTPAYNLTDDSIPDPLAFPLTNTTYVVTGFGPNGCYDKDTVVLLLTYDYYLHVPNAFSPNGDGLNDFFQFFTKGIRRIISVDIYSRWGEKIYSLESAGGEPWDGSYKDTPQGIGVYVYVIRAETFDGQLLREKGNVTLLR